jgi:hypothetical protein
MFDGLAKASGLEEETKDEELNESQVSEDLD